MSSTYDFPGGSNSECEALATEPTLAEKYEDAQNLLRQLMEQPVIQDMLHCRTVRFRSTLPWGYEIWVRKHLSGTMG